MERLKQKLRAARRRILARYLRSSGIAMVTWCTTGFLFSAFTIFWSIDSAQSIRQEKEKSDFLALKLVGTQIDTTVRGQLNLLSMASARISNMIADSKTVSISQMKSLGDPTLRVWIVNKNQPKLVGQSQKFISDPNLDLLVKESWLRISSQLSEHNPPSFAANVADMTLSNGGKELSFLIPVISSNGKVIGLVSNSAPVSKIQEFLPQNTYLINPRSNAFVAKLGAELDSIQASPSRDLGHSIAFRVQASVSSPSWRVRADHSSEELWAVPGIRDILNLNFGILVMVWGSIFFLIRSGNTTRTRQRMLIGSLVQKVIWITSEDGKIDYVLGKIGHHLGWKEVDYLDVHICLFIHPDDRAMLNEAIKNAHSSFSDDEILEIRFENKDREYRWYEVTLTNMVQVPEINGIVITAHDIEQRMHATAHIIASKRAAEKANEAKSEFLSRMSHELRTPLNAILGFGQLLEMEAISERQAENVDQILIAGRHLLALVNDILDIARIETRKVNLSFERVNLGEVIDESVALLAPLSTKSNISLTINHEGCPDVWSDRQRLKQIFLNVLSNGIKYNHDGGELRVSIETTDEGLNLIFADTGIGIEPKYIERIFTPFDRLGSDNSEVEGTGLGLALSKTLVDAMGLKLDVDSQFGNGSRFTLFFPSSSIAKPILEVIEHQGSDNSGFDNPNNLRVLLIEDNIVNLRYITKFVEKLDGVALIWAKEGGIGIEMARLHQPDLILLDLDLPDIDGKDVLIALQADPYTRWAHVVVMSGETSTHIAEEVISLGAHKFVTKPVDVGSLFSLFDEERKSA